MMRVRQRKVIDKDILQPWLLPKLTALYKPGLDVLNFGDVQVVKLLKFMRLRSDGSLICSMSDSNHWILAIITSQAICNFERSQRCRITSLLTNTLVLISRITLKWVSDHRFRSEFGDFIPDYLVDSYGMLVIDEIEVFDPIQETINVMLESVYQINGYREVVRPFEVPEDEYL